MGTFAVDPELTDINKIVATVLDELKLLIAQRELKITHTLSEIPPVLVDEKLIRIVFQNLLTNAIKYTAPKGEITITVRTAREGEVIGTEQLPCDAWYVSVSDTGCGIPSYQQDKIFTKLFRADNVRTLDTSGTGLGLYITKSIITESGGTIWFTSEENRGSTFSFWLPLKGMQLRSGTRSLEESHE